MGYAVKLQKGGGIKFKTMYDGYSNGGNWMNNVFSIDPDYTYHMIIGYMPAYLPRDNAGCYWDDVVNCHIIGYLHPRINANNTVDYWQSWTGGNARCVFALAQFNDIKLYDPYST